MNTEDLTYPAPVHGATARLGTDERLREVLVYNGFHIVEESAVVGRGQQVFERCADRLLDGSAHRLAGAPLRRPNGDRVTSFHAGDRVDVHPLGIGAAAAASPCLVLCAERTDRRAEMIYGTLPGHLERGEERFAVTMDDDGAVTVTVAAFSRPGHPLTKAAGAVGRRLQRVMSRRYVNAIGRGTGAPRIRRGRLRKPRR
ncbi:MAG: DUF1990 domain-containing protein [Gordonia sp. (in: high G+C Gram-positive bacteria)]|uniref:DUF1990 domain-containing protein n=1 Tax=Gordonia sp. (in: high G+C Gram-positive bacteria) TaxID=84139 RepID=UPI0039E56290